MFSCRHYITSFLQGFLLRSIAKDGIRIVIDGTQVGKENAALVISLVWQKRGIPICWFVKKGSKGHFKVTDHIEVIKQFTAILLPLLPEGMEVTLLGDGEFDSIELQEYCLSHSWNYVLRTACDTVLYENGDKFAPQNIGIPTSATHFFIAGIEFTQKRFQYIQLVVQHDKKHKKPIFLISNLEYAIDIIGYYKERYSIECLFRDMKTSSFNIHLTRLKKPEEVANLIIIAALAFIFLLLLGIQHDTLEWRKKVQRVRKDKKVLSLFSFACRLIVFLVHNEIEFILLLKFPQNPNDFSKSFTEKSFVGFCKR